LFGDDYGRNFIDSGCEPEIHVFAWQSSVLLVSLMVGKDKAIPLQALTVPEGSRRLRLPDFKTIGT
jgi:hypothetical protein